MQESNSPEVKEANLPVISLRRIFPDSRFAHCEDIKFTDLEADSRKVQPGQLFICLEGQQVDGHVFAKQSVERGACGLLVEHILPEISAPQCVVDNTRLCYGLLCQELFDQPASKLKIAGITGTNGKTTTVYIVQQLLTMLGEQCGFLGTIQNSDGLHTFPAAMTTPAAYELARWMRKMVDQKTSFLAMEVSSHALDQQRLAGVELSVGVIMNITHDHLDYHGDYTSYLVTKSRIQDLVSSIGLLLVNLDDAGCRQCLNLPKDHARVKCFGTSQGAEFRFELIDSKLSGTAFSLTIQGRSYNYFIPLIGKHNVYNTVAALAILHSWSFDLEELQKYTTQLCPAPGRLEKVEAGQPFTVLIDYAHTPDAIDHILTALRPLTVNRLICVLGAGGDRDRGKRTKMGSAGQLADILIITSDNPRSEDPQVIMDEIAAGCAPDKNIIVKIQDRREAIRQACKIAQVGDIVVIAGKGHESTQTIGNTVLQFNDRNVILDVLSL